RGLAGRTFARAHLPGELERVGTHLAGHYTVWPLICQVGPCVPTCRVSLRTRRTETLPVIPSASQRTRHCRAIPGATPYPERRGQRRRNAVRRPSRRGFI